MAQIDEIKEFIGLYKFLFGIIITILVSLISYVFVNFDILSVFKLIIISFVISILSVGLVYLMEKIITNIRKLKDL